MGVGGLSNLEQYFDYEAFGKNYDDTNSLSWQDGYVAEIVDGIDPDDSLEKDLEALYKSSRNVCPSVEELTQMFDKEKGSKGKEVAREAVDVATGASGKQVSRDNEVR